MGGTLIRLCCFKDCRGKKDLSHFDDPCVVYNGEDQTDKGKCVIDEDKADDGHYLESEEKRSVDKEKETEHEEEKHEDGGLKEKRVVVCGLQWMLGFLIANRSTGNARAEHTTDVEHDTESGQNDTDDLNGLDPQQYREYRIQKWNEYYNDLQVRKPRVLTFGTVKTKYFLSDKKSYCFGCIKMTRKRRTDPNRYSCSKTTWKRNLCGKPILES